VTVVRLGLVALVLTLPFASACGWLLGCPSDTDESYPDAVLAHAESDLDCKRGDIQVAAIRDPVAQSTVASREPTVARATGCGKIAEYDCIYGNQCGYSCSLRGRVAAP
jgi:hypothetical protein